MAVLSKNGDELARVDDLTASRSYRSNGYILINRGDGWRRANKRPNEKIQKLANDAATWEAELCEGYQQFKAALHSCADLAHRALVLDSVKRLKGDPDGLFSELEELGTGVTIADAKLLAEAYMAYQFSLKDEPFAVNVKWPGDSLYTTVGIVVGDSDYRKQKAASVVETAAAGEGKRPTSVRRELVTLRFVDMVGLLTKGTIDIHRQYPESDSIALARRKRFEPKRDI